MKFNQYPPAYAPVGIGCTAMYRLQLDEPGNIDLRIRDSASGDLLGGKRFVNVSLADIDIAPRIRDAMTFTPSTGETGFKPVDGRVVKASVEALRPGSDTIELSVGARTFIPGDQSSRQSEAWTTMPLNRLIPAGEADEISIYHNRYCNFLVTGSGPGTTVAQQFESPLYGLQAFRLNTADFPDCDTITVDTGLGQRIVYTVIPASQQAMRLAWRSHAGSIEHYSFPTLRETALRVDRQLIESAEGHRITAAGVRRETTLVSAFELPEVLEALAELTSACDVWSVRKNLYTPVEVLTDEAVIQRHGTLCALEVVVRPKTAGTWS